MMDAVKYTLGLDLGTNSVGWAAVRLDERGRPCGVLDMGVRIFPDGREPGDRPGRASLAVERRMARGARRRRDRYLKRRSDLMETLVACGLMPPDSAARKGLERLDPYELRSRALDHPLKPFELGRALFHLDQRRGFKSNRKAAARAGDEDEAKGTRAEIDRLRASIAESGARTLGDFLAARRAAGRTVRARPGEGLYPDRALYEEEFDAIRAAQEPHHALRPEQWDAIRHIIFFQRPLKAVEPGWCLLEDGERRAPRALPIAQEFRMLQEIANLRLRSGFESERRLDEGERARALARLRSGMDINLERPVAKLGLPPDAVFNLSRGVRKKVKGDETTARLKKPGLFGKRWLSLPLEERNEIVHFLLDTEDPEEVRSKAGAEWGLTGAQAAAVADVALPDRHANLSEKAIRRILPFMEEQGLGYSDAVVAAGYPHHSDFRNPEAHSSLPYYGAVLERDVVGANPQADPADAPAHYGRIANPTVHIGLGQLRRVTNRLITAYGKPQDIVVELARDLKANREQLNEYARRQREGGQQNERLRKELEAAEQPVTPEVLRKLRLWEEQGQLGARLCPYTGEVISFTMAVSAATEIDHILPFSRTLDNSLANQVVCVAAANRAKGNRTPHEAFGHSPQGYDYDGILARTATWGNKAWRFQKGALEEFESQRDFLDRQLNETRYLSRTARTYLAHLYNEKDEGRQRVRVIPGQMTALLRRAWGLTGMLHDTPHGEAPRKQRDDHRHHAIDAFVVANTTQGLFQQFAEASAQDYGVAERLASLVPKPWDGFHREQLRPFLDRMVVSHRPDHGARGVSGKTTGQLHNDTAYGLVEPLGDGQWKVVVRKLLSDLSRNTGRRMLEAVRDRALRDALLTLWDATLGMGGTPAEFAERAATDGVSVGGRMTKVRRVRVLDTQRVIPIADRQGRPYKAYVPGGNEFADVWRLPDGQWQTVVVRRFDANQPGFDPVALRPHPAAKRLMRLQINDMMAFGTGADCQVARVCKITVEAGREFVYLAPHVEADVDRRNRDREDPFKYLKKSARQLRREGFRKVGVDEIGRLRDPGPRPS